MTWKAEIDSGRCMASGMCAGIAPDLFVLDEEHARPLGAEVPREERVLDAADSCPALAIIIRDGTTTVGPRP
ncbi:ferredoxin [Streptomyces luomodiensis]|uniref:Ferredoxin n=1 Tax=Streptomyces luomodiensis TaxID=3026192 RepID=A0ABY9V776_9ACTN|nr:ferredoxin [Streptomyces sp. SCA4-21]WNF00487.1 ferredoxin [Streptomyces sp. SCA4-21]